MTAIPTRTGIDIHAHCEVTPQVTSPPGPGKFNVAIESDSVRVTIYFDSPEQLQAFDESLHGDIEDALFRHVHGQALDEKNRKWYAEHGESIEAKWDRAIAEASDQEGA